MKKQKNKNSTTNDITLFHPNYGLVTLFDDIGKRCIVKTEKNELIGVTTGKLKQHKNVDGEIKFEPYVSSFVPEPKIKKKRGGLCAKPERNEEVRKMLLDQKSYVRVAEHFGVTKQRIKQIANVFKIDLMGDRKKETFKLIKQIKKDNKNGLTYQEIVDKHKLNNQLIQRMSSRGYNLISLYKEKRNELLTKKYKKGKLANQLISNDPKDISTVNGVYQVVSNKFGVYKHPEIKRGVKGLFERPEILKIIKKERKLGLSCAEIADKLNKAGHKTLTGKKFTTNNLYCKVLKINDESTKKYKVR